MNRPRRFLLPYFPCKKLNAIRVAHGSVKDAVIFSIDIDRKQRVVFCWDIDVPSTVSPFDGKANLQIIKDNLSYLQDADLLIIEANTFEKTTGPKGKPTGHTSYKAAGEFIALIDAKRVLLTHLSGHEDGEGNPGFGRKDSAWETALACEAEGIGIAKTGMVTLL